MPLADVFASPLGLAALVGVVPLLLLYLIQPDPRELALPTVQFLQSDPDEGGSNPVFERLRRNLLLFLQLLVISLLAVALAAPYVTVTQAASAQPTVLVVDASASMATDTGDGTRFAKAVAAAKQSVGTPTTVVVAGATTRVPAERVSPGDAKTSLDDLAVTDAPGDLRGAISRATALAGSESRIVVFSDFAGDGGDWQGAVQTARASGLDVSLRQFAGGGDENVGIVDRQFGSQRVTVSVANTGETAAERTLSLAGRSRSLSLEPGDVQSVTFPLPTQSATARLSPGDSFPTDDVAHVTVPAQRTVDTLLITNGDNRNLRTALDVIPTVDLTVRRPPASVAGSYDVVVFADVDSDRVLGSTKELARKTVADGGGLVVQGQADVGRVGYGSLLPVNPQSVRNTTGETAATDHELTNGFDFPTPDEHLGASTARADALVTVGDGSPLLATARRSGGRVLYYGYLPNQTAFRYSYRYPVFWKGAIHWAADRPSADELNYRTGTTLQLPNRTTVETPGGTRTAAAVRLDAVGTYRTPDRRASASLLSASESNLTAPAPDVAGGNVTTSGAASEPVRQDLTPLVLLVAVLLVLGELGFLRYRGDL
ncbi:BatA domain-containing protein [Halorientalis brevis]|uniref:BatA domain-containing protein n=1 Tax=Halorientalis brevis TaxID=1126241 RepID=A0ABD6CE90_9EURY|nr:BatA domain-containing protein [Halorientalis brevis]